LFVCLIPTTIGGLLPAIGIAGMDRALRANVLAKSGRAVEVAGDVDILLLDKTGTITVGARQATQLAPLRGVSAARLREAAVLASLEDPTPEGRSIVALARAEGSGGGGAAGATFEAVLGQHAHVGRGPPDGRRMRKGAVSAIGAWIDGPGRRGAGASSPGGGGGRAARRHAAGRGEGARCSGVVALSDVLKPGIEGALCPAACDGHQTMMVTGDNPLTAAAIAAEAGVDGFLAEATPEDKLARIREEQARASSWR
jgi:K+-transporting ATPase ATPase B chain